MSVVLLCSIWSVVGALTVASLAVMTIRNDQKEYKRRQEMIAALKELKQAVDETADYMEEITK